MANDKLRNKILACFVNIKNCNFFFKKNVHETIIKNKAIIK